MEDSADKSAAVKFRDPYLSSDGSIIGVQPGDKLFFETRIVRSADLSTDNINLIVKSIIKTVTNNQVQVSDVEVLGSFQDPVKQTVFKNIDISRFQSQFRLKSIKLSKGEKWGIVPNKVRSGLSQILHQEDLYAALGFPTPGESEQTSAGTQLSSSTESVLEMLLQYNIAQTDAEVLMQLFDVVQTDVPQLTSATSILNCYNHEEVQVDDTKYQYLGILQAIAQLVGASLTSAEGTCHTKLQELSSADIENHHPLEIEPHQHD